MPRTPPLVLAAALAALAGPAARGQPPHPGPQTYLDVKWLVPQTYLDVTWLDPLRYYDLLRERVADLRPPEFVEYVYWNVTGKGNGWFHPGASRYGWAWLADRYDADGDGRITRKEFKGPAEWFDRLDRNRDGFLTAANFDWPVDRGEAPPGMAGPMAGPGAMPDREMLFQRFQQMMSAQLFHKIDAKGKGRISREDWDAVFTRAAKGKDHLTPEDLREALAVSPRRPGGPGPGSGIAATRIVGMFKAETGSPFEGPSVGEAAPDFTLRTHDGKREVSLRQYRGKKPVVLVFGNYT
jgi:hypothetical protein